MMISTKGRYALRVLIDLGEHQGPSYIPLRDMVERQHVSPKYIERIMVMLSKGGLVDAAHGKGGGYRLNRDARDYKVGDILRLTEGTLSPVACLEDGAPACPYAGECRTLPLWQGLDRVIETYLDSVTLADLMRTEPDRS